ncbi:MAG: ferrous iron transport protein B [Bacteroidetes bacterium]|nr:MAG: ferrous iron transport protein B [Bacteroidota bacterium]
MNLSELKNNERGVITKVKGRGAFRKRITEMGFIKGETVTVIKNAPLKDPIEYSIMGYHISLRRSEAALVEVITEKEAKDYIKNEFNGTIGNNILKSSAKKKSRHINIALVGNPNCGKTTLFNNITGSKEHVGNYGGVTVDAKKASRRYHGYKFDITDLPGTYSITAYSPEELYVREHIFDEIPDIVVNVVDVSNLERNLYLTTRLIDMDIKIVIALNMYDELEKRGDKFDYRMLAKMIGVPIVPTVASAGKGIPELFDELIKVYEDEEPIVRHVHVNYGKSIEKSISGIQEKIYIRENVSLTSKVAPRFLALSLLEKDKSIQKRIRNLNNGKQIINNAENAIKKLETNLKDDTETLITDARYGFIRGALKETYKRNKVNGKTQTQKIDKILTHKFWGIPIFIFFMWLMFQLTFSLGEYPMTWIENGVSLLAKLINNVMPDGMLKDLIADGIIGGVGGVIVFLPNILILFFIISFMEDTGYMARAAFITDKLMHKIGLHGKSFIPLVMGFGCNVPAVMATRTLESRNDRLLTMLINPFMSCSARLPIYLVIIGAVFPENAGSVLFLIYGTGILLSIIVAKLFKKVIFKSKDAPFVMELPPYRKPMMKISLIHMWHKGSQYLQKMGGVILIASIIIWALGYFPLTNSETEKIDKQIVQLNKENQKQEDNAYQAEIQKLELEKHLVHQENSYIGRIGHFVEPAIRPLGFDWKMGVSITAGVAAKEIVVSTMGVLYGAEFGADDSSDALIKAIKKERYPSGKHKGELIFSPLVSISFLIFILVYFPCVAVVAAVKKESGSWKWAAFLVFYTTSLAWLLSFAVYQIGSLFI